MDVLVLNRGWNAINVVDHKRAISLIYTGAAKAVDHATYATYAFDDWKDLSQDAVERYLSTINFKFKIPEIIILCFTDRLPTWALKEPKVTRQNIFTRDHFRCAYCGKSFKGSIKDLTVEHVIPRAHGGRTTWDNTVTACFKCNTHKGSKTLAESGMTLQFQPFKPKKLFHGGAIAAYRACESWKKFVDYSYWNCELEE